MEKSKEFSMKTSTPSQLNIPRIILGGVITGLILFIGSGIVNGAILSREYKIWSEEMGMLIHPLKFSLSMTFWFIMSLIQGIVSIWIYAGLSRVYGTGIKSVFFTGILVWILSKLIVAIDLTALGVLTPTLIAGQLIGGLVFILFGVYIGSRFYKEKISK